jgi:uncharacterized protein YceH (UPF0502 family)
MTLPTPLSPLEARVIGVLVEKQLTTPDNYPLTLNSLAAGCNQKSSRHPVMNVSDVEVQDTLDSLKRRTLVLESYGASGRVLRYAHNLSKVLGLGQTSTILIAVLMLRGPQTPGELRLNCERMHRFADISSVEAYLDELSERSAGALVVRLPKQPGSREHRWAHLLCGPVEAEAYMGAAPQPEIPLAEAAALRAELDQLRQEVAQLRALVEALKGDTGTAA